ncbi:MAG TPA: hypothetical protein VK181_04450 [Rhizobium sp.]|nr:hypothetical protein [Rhizobium sp.]
MTLAFEYLEIRPCIYLDDDDVMSYTDEISFELARSGLSADDATFSTGWAIYGRYADEAGQFLTLAIGDFSTKEGAFAVMDAILAPLAKARDELAEANRNFSLDDPVKRRAYLTAIMDVHNDLDDFINQSSNRTRL